MKKMLVFMALAAISCANKTVDVPKIATLAGNQCLLMEEFLTDETLPRTFRGDTLVTSGPDWWCSGFYPGTCWYDYKLGGDPALKDLALRQTAKVLDVERLNAEHDLGFQVMGSARFAFDETGDSLYLQTLFAAADKLARRFSPVTGVIKSWNWEEGYPVIIDNMMNLELLTWASRQFDRPDWMDIALSHARKTRVNHFRPDGSSYHLVNYNPADGSILGKQTVQGYADDSSWARGQAWGLYGFTMMYRETGLPEFLEQAEKVASYLLPLLKDRPVPAWDFCAPPESIGQDDASAAAIMASAFLELCQLTPDSSAAALYRQEGEDILKALSSDKYLCRLGECAGFLLKHSTGNYSKGSEVDVPLSYADYYYMEALYRYMRLSNPETR